MKPLDPIYVPLLTFLGTLLIVAVGILFNNSRITDMKDSIKDSIADVKDLIKGESRVTEAKFRRLDEKIDRVENLLLTRLASHDRRIDSPGIQVTYSALNVSAGSTRAARHAGTQQAIPATAASNAITPT